MGEIQREISRADYGSENCAKKGEHGGINADIKHRPRGKWRTKMWAACKTAPWKGERQVPEEQRRMIESDQINIQDEHTESVRIDQGGWQTKQLHQRGD